MGIQKNISLKPFNTFNLNSEAKFFAKIESTEELHNLIQSPFFHHKKRLILGGGSNILLTGNFDGLVLFNKIMGIENLYEDDDHVYLKVGSGENWHALVLHCIALDYAGIENLSLIPGTVGAAPMQNIGAYGVEQDTVFELLEAVNLKTGSVETFNREQCEFGYRTSVFKTHLKNKYFITSVTYRLNKHPNINTSYGAIQETLAAMNITTPTIRHVSDAVIHIRSSKLPNPEKIGNAGSFFKNPVIRVEHFERLKARNERIPYYPVDSDHVKIPAGWLIEQCGWKGKRRGEIGVHDKQALVLVNYANGKGWQIRQLAEDIRKSVYDQFGIMLETEVNIV